jgi:hypothetical protein
VTRIWKLTASVPGEGKRWVRYEGEEKNGEVVFYERASRHFILRLPLDSALFLARHPKYLGPHMHLGFVVARAEA